LYRESRDGSRLALIKDLEVFLFQVVNGAALLIADDNWNEHPIHVDLDVGGGGLRGWRLLRGRVRAEKSQAKTDPCQRRETRTTNAHSTSELVFESENRNRSRSLNREILVPICRDGQMVSRVRELGLGSCFPTLAAQEWGTRGRADCCIANAQRKIYSVFDAALGEDAFLVGVFDFAHFGDGVGEFD
jgi:hypothetical protein